MKISDISIKLYANLTKSSVVYSHIVQLKFN